MSNTVAVWTRREVVRDRGVRRAIGVAAFAAATALGAKVAMPLPGTPVPFTLQVLFILLSGALLGPRLGALSQALYLAVGALGAPVFAAGGGWAYLLGPTAGYLWAAPLAAYVAGAVIGRSAAPLRLALGLLAGLAAIYAGGFAWLAIWAGPGSALRLGVLPFIGVDLLKATLALLLASRWRARALELFG